MTVPESQRTRLILDVLHGLLTSPLPRLSDLLTELARAFEATGAGVTGVLADVPRVEQRIRLNGPAPLADSWPWTDRPELSARLRQGGAEAATGTANESLLLALVWGRDGDERVHWLEAPAGRAWSDGERAALVFAAQLVARAVPPESGPPRLQRRDQAQLQQRLLDAAAISGRIAHAFDNVLTGILGFAELTLHQAADATQQQYLGEVLLAAQSGIELTQQLHLFHRCAVASSGPTRLGPVVLDEEMRLRQALDARVELATDVPSDLPPVAVDGEPLRQVLAQLLNNAHESLNGAGSITLSGRPTELSASTCAPLYGSPRPGPHVALTVSDTGGGLSADARQRLFHEPFFTTKPRHRGLGLAVVYRILHAHRGGFQLEAGPERGTSACVYLPLASATAAPTGIGWRDRS